MKINDLELSTFSAKLLNRVASTQSIDNITNWFAGANEGEILRQARDFRTIKITVLIEEDSEDSAYKQISRLTEELKECQIVFDDIDLIFNCYCESSTNPQRLQKGVFKLTYFLKNDWGKGNATSFTCDLVTAEIQEITIHYIENWSNTIHHYLECFDEEDIYQPIATEKVYIDKSQIAAAADSSISWTTMFLALGIDVNKYKPQRGNTFYGFPSIDADFEYETAASIFASLDEVKILYNRFSVDGEPDLPTNVNYPSVVWTTGANNEYYFDLGIGQGWNTDDISYIVYGRYFENVTGTSGNESIIGTGESGNYEMSLVSPNLIVYPDAATIRQFEVIKNTTSTSGGISIVTSENISDMPLRRYGFKSSNEGKAPVKGYMDVLFNGITLDRIPTRSVTLTDNLTLFKGKHGIAKYCEACRIQIFYKGNLVKDYIPVNGNIKNCFINNYDVGLYDLVSMTYLPWSKKTGEHGSAPSIYMPIPDTTSAQPEITPESHLLTVLNGSGSGSYPIGTKIRIVADYKPNYSFKNWNYVESELYIDSADSADTYVTIYDKDTTVIAEYDAIITEPTYSFSVIDGSGSGSYHINDRVEIKAIEKEHYNFTRWEIIEGTSTTINNYFASVTYATIGANNTIIKAVYEYIEPVTPSPTPSASYQLTVVDGTGTGIYNKDDVVQIRAAIKDNYEFVRWEILSEDGSLYIENATKPTTYVSFLSFETAKVSAIYRYIEPSSETSLRVISGTGSGQYLYNSQVEVTAVQPTQYTNYQFLKWVVLKGNAIIENELKTTTNITIKGNEEVVIQAKYRCLDQNVMGKKYSFVGHLGLTVYGGTNFEQGDIVYVETERNNPDFVFVGYRACNGGDVWCADVDTLMSGKTIFCIEPNDVTLDPVWDYYGPTPELLLYTIDVPELTEAYLRNPDTYIDNLLTEEVMGANAGVWNTQTRQNDGPPCHYSCYTSMFTKNSSLSCYYAVCSIPAMKVAKSFASVYTIGQVGDDPAELQEVIERGTDKWGRFYMKIKVLENFNMHDKDRMYVSMNLEDGTVIKQSLYFNYNQHGVANK